MGEGKEEHRGLYKKEVGTEATVMGSASGSVLLAPLMPSLLPFALPNP